MNRIIVRRMINEEIDRNVRLDMILSREDIRALKIVEARARSLNESGWGIVKTLGLMALKSTAGRRLLIALLKALRFVVDIGHMPIEKVGVPMWNAVIKFLKSKGINIPFNADDIWDFAKYVCPSYLASMAVSEAIEFLNDINDSEYLEMIGEKKKEPKKELPDSKDRPDRKELPDKGPPPELSDEEDEEPGIDSPRAVAERRLRVRRHR